MKRIIKEALILYFLNRKKRKEPFDEIASELYNLPNDADINQNNSHFFTASSVSGEFLSIRLGMRNGSDYEIFVLFRTRDGRFFVQEKDSYAPSECPVRFDCIETGDKWRIRFDGSLVQKGSDTPVEAHIDVEFSAVYPIYDFVYHADKFIGMASSIAREKWNKPFFESLGKNNQRHYEQAGKVCGQVNISGEQFNIDLRCVRDHSFGRREWDMMNDHIWLLGLTQNGKVLCFSIVNYPTMKRIFSGYSDFFGDRLETIRDYELLEYDPSNGLGPDRLVLRCHFEGARSLDVEIERTDNIKCLFGSGCYAFQEGIGDFTINGVRGSGTIEYGYNSDISRWEGYSKLK